VHRYMETGTSNNDALQVRIRVDQGRWRVVRRLVAAAALIHLDTQNNLKASHRLVALHRPRVGETSLRGMGLLHPRSVVRLSDEQLVSLAGGEVPLT
jgi:16S rRNA U516 pseudouridylate synthase RsuA-like enzyme